MYLHNVILSVCLHHSLWSTTLGNFYSSQKCNRTAFTLTIIRSLLERLLPDFFLSLMDHTWLTIQLSISLAKMMTFDAEYPTKDWLKSSQNARPIDIIREKTNDWLKFCSYKLMYYHKEVHVNQDLNLYLQNPFIHVCQNGG